jgi:hypothetical protein
LFAGLDFRIQIDKQRTELLAIRRDSAATHAHVPDQDRLW